ncbi:MAG: terpene synthase family protein [Pseudonocardiaceae bacterium]
MKSTALPMIELPFPARLHPDAERIEAYVLDWAARFQLPLNGLAAQHFGMIAAYCYPAGTFPGMELAAASVTWQFLTDDQYEEGPYGSVQRWAGAIKAVRGVLGPDKTAGPLDDAPLIRALADLAHRLDAMMSPAWSRRYANHMVQAMEAVTRELRLRDDGTPPPLVDQVEIRRGTGGCFPFYDIMDAVDDGELPDEVHDSPVYQELLNAGADIMGWSNDLHSLDKEIACGMVYNIVLVLQRERNLDREQAFSQARILIADRVNDLLATQRRLPDLCQSLGLDQTTQDVVHRRAASLLDMIAGCNQWYTNTARYQQPIPEPQTKPVEDLFAPGSS